MGWTLKWEYFGDLCRKWEIPQVDLIASKTSAGLPKFLPRGIRTAEGGYIHRTKEQGKVHLSVNSPIYHHTAVCPASFEVLQG